MVACRSNSDEDIDDGLTDQARHRRRAERLDAGDCDAERRAHALSLVRVSTWPLVIRSCDGNRLVDVAHDAGLYRAPKRRGQDQVEAMGETRRAASDQPEGDGKSSASCKRSFRPVCYLTTPGTKQAMFVVILKFEPRV